MKKSKQLPIVVPRFSTYHYQLASGIPAAANPGLDNWFINNCVSLRCGRRFLDGFTTPEVNIEASDMKSMPYMEKVMVSGKFLDGKTAHDIICRMIDRDYYVYYDGVDDKPIKGKTFYGMWHFRHDGIICGYDDAEKTYTVAAYDSRWVCRPFKIRQSHFERGRKFYADRDLAGSFIALKADPDIIELDVPGITEKLREYLRSDITVYPESGRETVYGSAVHQYLAMYLDRLHDGRIPYGRKDKRILRVIWEHKKCMLQRLERMSLAPGQETSDAVKEYRRVVNIADNARLCYAKYVMKEDKSLLNTVRDKLLKVWKLEREILTRFLSETEEKQNAMAIH